MSDMGPLISVIITAYNRREYLVQAVESALNQTLPPNKYEIILTKNFETDYDGEWEKRGVRIVRFEQGWVGQQVADALRHCRGKLVALLDDDDWWEPNKLEHVEALWHKHHGLSYYHHAMAFEFDGIIDHAWRQMMVDFSRRWKRISPWHNNSSSIIAKDILLDRLEYLKRLQLAIDLFFFVAAKTSGGKLVSDDAALTHFRVPTAPRQGRGDPYHNDWLLAREMIVESGDRRLLRYFDLLTAGEKGYWDCVDKIKKGQKVALREFLAYTAYCVRFRPQRGGRRLFIMGVGLLSPKIAGRAYRDKR